MGGAYFRTGQDAPQKQGSFEMKTSKSLTVVVMLALVALFGTFVSSASADVTVDDLLAQIAQLQAQLLAQQNGGGQPTEPPQPVVPDNGSLSNSINLDGFSFWYNTSTTDNQSYFGAGMTSATDRIMYASVRVDQRGNDPLEGWISADFNGIVNQPAGQMLYMSQSQDFHRHGAEYFLYSGVGSKQEIVGFEPAPNGGYAPILGDWMSTANISVVLTDVTPTTADSYYNEWTDAESGVTYFNAGVNWHLYFSPDTSGISALVGVPEPATLAMLGLGAIALIRRRHRS